MAADDDLVFSDVRDGVALLTLHRPDRKNAWSYELQTRLFDRLDEAAADPEVRAIVLTGAGPFFCPGADPVRLGTTFADGLPDVPGDRPMTHPLSSPKPIVGALNGACAGFGFVLAAMCDVRFAAAGAKFTTSFARRGTAAEHTISYLLPRIVGLQRALDLLLTGRPFLADEAEAIGFVLRTVPPEELVDTALGYARQLAEWSSPLAMAVIRHQVYADLDNDFPTARAQSLNFMKRYSQGGDFGEGVASFNERRSPRFAPLPPGFAVTQGED